MAQQFSLPAGVRLPWSALPAELRTLVEDHLGAPIVETISPEGGFSPGVVARVRAANGARAFIKAVTAAQNPDSPRMYRQEARVVAALPASVPAPRLLWWHDGGDYGWVLLVFEDIDGRPPNLPWRAGQLDRVITAMIQLGAALTPSPIDAPSAERRFTAYILGWRQLRNKRPDGLDAWSVRHLSRLAELEAGAPAAVRGESLVHLDSRADNLLLTEDRVYVIDWPHACIGADWIDPIIMAPSVAMQGGPQPEEFIQRFPAVRAADSAAISAAIVSLAGYFTRQSLLPAPLGLPTIRAFQSAQGGVCRRWLEGRLGLR